MSNIKITDLVDQRAFEQLNRLENNLDKVEQLYTKAARTMLQGLNVKVNVVGDFDKLTNIASTGMRQAEQATKSLTESVREQAATRQALAKAVEAENKAELAAIRAKQAAAKQTKSAKMTEEERLKLIRSAIPLTNQEVHSIKEAQEANKRLRDAVKNLKDTDADFANTLNKLNNAINSNNAYIKRNSDEMTKQKMTVGDYKNQIIAAMNELGKGGNVMKNFGTIASSTGGIMREKFAGGFSAANGGIMMFVKGMIGANIAMAAIQTAISAVKSFFNTIKDFEFSNSKLKAILGETSEGMRELEANAKLLGSTTRYTAAEVTNLQIELAKLGFTKQQILGMTDGVLKFAMAVDTDLASAASLAGAAMRMFGAEASETDRYVSAMAVATTKSALSFSYLQTALPIVGAVANQFNFSIEDTLALVAQLANAGLDASMAATATRNIILKLADGNSKLAKTLGHPIKSLDELGSALNELKQKGIDLGTEFELVGPRCVTALALLTDNNEDLVTMRDNITGVEDELDNMADTMADNVEGSIKSMQSAWEGLMLVFEGSKGVIKDVIDFIADAIRTVADYMSSIDQLKERYTAKFEIEFEDKDVSKAGKEKIKELAEKYKKDGMSEADALAKARGVAVQEAVKHYKDNIDQLKASGEFDILEEWSGYDMSKMAHSKIGIEYEKAFSKWNANLSLMRKVSSELMNYNPFEAPAKPNSVVVPGGGGNSARELERQRQEQLRIEKDYQRSVVEIQEDGIEKQLANIAREYTERIASVKGNSEKENQTRINLGIAMQNALAKKQKEWEEARMNEDLKNRLAVAEKGSLEEFKIKEAQLSMNEQAEKEAAARTGADVAAIEAKYNKLRTDLAQKFYDDRDAILYSRSTQSMNTQYTEELTELDKWYSEQIAIHKEGSKRRIEIEREYEERRADIELYYAKRTALASINYIEQQLKSETLTDDQRIELEQKLADEKVKLEKKIAEATIAEQNRVAKNEQDTKKQRISAAQEVLQNTMEAANAAADLASAIFDRQMQDLDEKSEKNQEAHDAEIENIERLEESGAISKEEAESRKRSAERKTKIEEERIAKEKAALQLKQAKLEKAMNIMQIVMNTATAIMRCWSDGGPFAGAPLAAMVGAIGALQLAAAIAQPLPKYKDGTAYHPGGPAIVGDGGKVEGIILPNGKTFLTPDVPTMINLPRGAEVIPDAMRSSVFEGLNPTPLVSGDGKAAANTVVINDYSSLQTSVDRQTDVIRAQMRQQAKLAKAQQYAARIARKM